MNRIPIRLRLTGAFALASALVLALAGVLVYLRVEAALSSTLDESLEARLADLRPIVESGGGPATLGGPGGEDDEIFSQVLDEAGAVVATTGPVAPAITAAQAEAALAGQTVTTTAEVTGIEGEARVRAAGGERGGRELTLVVGNSTEDREETLAELLGAFAIGGPLALGLAAGLGYLLAGSSLRPVERMRRRAAEITLARREERLPLPEADDEIARLGRTLNEMLARLEDSLERERRLVGDASHELRTPLTVMRAELELGAKPGAAPEEMRAALRSAIEEVDRLSRLADDLLLIARSDRGRLEIIPERVEIGALVARLAERYGAVAAASDRSVEVEADEAPTAAVDRLRIEQALSNLIDNALRHGTGTVTLSVRVEGPEVVIAVGDEGEGFDPGFAQRAFERFSRAEQGRTEGGAGLGLAIVAAIAAAHGGRAAIAADRCSVELRLPLQAAVGSSAA